jgi:CubicO group peptidase (beta-lactamase class C family)
VRDVFADNFRRRGEIGAACAAYYRGDKVVDLWGGVRDLATGEPWEEDTLVMVFSTTKGMAAIALAVAHSRRLYEYDAPVARYWPEFAQNGKEAITVRQLLSHQAGLCAVDEVFDAAALGDLDRVARGLAQQKPAWTPGEKCGYHAFSLGWYEGELIRRVDPKHRTLGRFFAEEVAAPLGIEFYIGLPPTIPAARVAKIQGATLGGMVLHARQVHWPFMLGLFNPRSLTARAVNNPRVHGDPSLLDTPEYRAVEFASAGGVGQARAVARAYSAMAAGGSELGIKPSTFDELVAPPRAPTGGWRDEVLRLDSRFWLGFLRPNQLVRFGSSERAFGHPGAGGSFGFADPDLGVGFAYVMNRMGYRMYDDPREKPLRDALYACIKKA